MLIPRQDRDELFTDLTPEPVALGRSTSLKTRLIALAVLAVGSAGAVLTGLALWQETGRYAASKTETFVAQARVLAAAVAEPCARQDRAAIFQTLRAIGDIAGLIHVGVRDRGGLPLGDLGASERLQSDVDIDGTREGITLAALLTTHSVAVAVPIVHGGRRVGTLQLVGDTSDLAGRLAATLQTAMAGLALALGVAAVIAWRLQRAITRPLQSLTEAMRLVGGNHDYALSLKPSPILELGILTGGFNRMLADIKDRDARIAASHAHLEDEVAERTADLREAKDAAEIATRQKSDFLATMSHEIRTPMNGMLVMADLLAAADLPARARRYAEVISRSGRSLLAIINDILDFSKIEAGKLDLECVPIDLAEAAGTVLDLFFEKARGQGLDLAAVVAVDLPERIPGDPVRLNQVLGNFINNAVKFTERGGVRLDIARDPAAPERIRFSVTDTGIGIAADKIETIFGAFSQADQSTTRRYGGTGLGLAISRKLVEAMGAEIVVTSIQGQGSTFAFSLPLAQAEALDGTAWPHHAGAEPPLVLSCLGGAFTQAAAAAYLEAGGCRVLRVAPDALPALLPAGARLLLLDAARATRPIVTAAQAAACRVVVLAAPGEAPQGVEPGSIDAVLARPLARRDMRNLLSALLAGSPLAPAAGPAAPSERTRFTGARALVADDNAVNREVAAEALNRLGLEVHLVEDGAAAVAAWAAQSFDIVFMDGSMPVLDGFAATRQIRSMERAEARPPLPIVALTAHVIGTSSSEWSEAGMNGVLHKPFTLQALSDCVARFLAPSAASAAPEGAPADAEFVAEVAAIDPNTIEELHRFAAAGRQDFVARVVGLYLDHAPKALRDIQATVIEGEAAKLAKAAHALKSMSLNIGARRVAALAGQMEAEARQQVLPDPAMLAELDRLIGEACLRLEALSSGARRDAAA